MAFDYDTANTGVFTRLGKLVKKINAYLALATTTLPADLKEIADLYEAADMTLQIEGLFSTFEGFKGQQTGRRQALGAFATRTLTDRDTVLEQLAVLSPDIQAVLTTLHNQMIIDAKTVRRSTVTLGAVTAAAANQGNGTILTSKLLDGYNPPLLGSLSHLKYNGLNSELGAPTETMTVECVADSMRDGTEEGGEQLDWIGAIPDVTFGWQDEGSGQGPALTVAGTSTLVSDGNFENWGGTGNNTPSNWTIDAGTAGTHIFRESAAANIYRGTYSMRFAGTGAQATIGVSQTVSPTLLRSRRRYNVSVRIKSSAVPAAGTIAIQFKGTGYTAPASEKIEILAASFPATFTIYNFFISMPNIIPSDWKLAVEITGTLSAGINVYFDSLCFKEVEYHGGQGAVAVPGSTRFVVGDRFTWTTTNDDLGVFQKFFRQWYQFQLPSALSPGQTIADTLAT